MAKKTGNKPPLTPRSVSDSAYPIVSMIVRLVPASRWSFARVGTNGDLVDLFSSDAAPDAPTPLSQDEFQRQRLKATSGSRIAATLGPLGEYDCGITLLFADAHTDFGILTLLRTAALGAFTSSEISILTIALGAATDRFSALRLRPALQEPAALSGRQEGGITAESADGAFYVLDQDLQIILAWTSEDQRRIALTGLHTPIAERLPLVLEETVRELTAGWADGSAKEPGVGHPVPFLVVRTRPMSGPAGLFIGVRIDRFRPPNSLTGAAERFHISPREVQVLALLLDGNHLEEIATRLHIASSTVQDHIRSMLEKTQSRNRSELIARALGWDSTPSVHEA
jgi:DNA-binding CsgD family transcriptional regulator